jgi:maleate isomerase
MENDFHKRLPPDKYTVHTDRMYLVETTRDAELRMIREFAKPAASDLGTVIPDVFVFGCTSAGSLFGLEYDLQVCRVLGELAGCPALGVINAVSTTLDSLTASRIAVITPYVEDLTQSVSRAIQKPGRGVVAAFGMGITVNAELADPTPGDIVDFARRHLRGFDFDALFVSCTNFRALEAKDELESTFAVPVITSNSAIISEIRRRYG